MGHKSQQMLKRYTHTYARRIWRRYWSKEGARTGFGRGVWYEGNKKGDLSAPFLVSCLALSTGLYGE